MWLKASVRRVSCASVNGYRRARAAGVALAEPNDAPLQLLHRAQYRARQREDESPA